MKLQLLLLASAVFGAFTPLHSQDSKKVRFGLFASPDLSFRSLAGNSGINGQIADSRDQFEKIKIGFTAGGEAIYRLSDRISFTGGVQFSVKGEKTDVFTLVYIDPVSLNMIPAPAGEPTTAKFIYNTRYIDLPLRMDYYFSRKKIAPFITGGISTNIYVNERTIAVKGYADGSEKESATVANGGYHRVNPQVQLGGGIDVELKTGILRVLPIARMSVLPVNKGPVDGYFYSVGLGVNYFL